MAKKKIVAVHWKDPTIEAGWVEDDHDRQLVTFVSYGVLISKDKGQVVLAGTVSPEDKVKRYADRTKFPKGCVVKIEIIGEVNLK